MHTVATSTRERSTNLRRDPYPSRTRLLASHRGTVTEAVLHLVASTEPPVPGVDPGRRWWLRRLEAFERVDRRIVAMLENPGAYRPIPVPKWVRSEAVRLAGALPLPELRMSPGRVAFVGYHRPYGNAPASISVTWKALRAGRACVVEGLRRAFEHAEAEAARAALAS